MRKKTNLPVGEYEEFEIPRRGKTPRKIVAPSSTLLEYQRKTLPKLEALYSAETAGTVIEDTAHGFMKGRNCVTAATKHIGYKMTIMMDISAFFDSVTRDMISPIKNQFSNDDNFWHSDGYAAQGFATSPMLANLAVMEILKEIDYSLSTAFKDYAFTIYADDLHISIQSEDYRKANAIMEDVKYYFEQAGFRINERKNRIRYAKFGYRRILGINVGDTEIRASRKTMRKLRCAKHQNNGPSIGGLTTWSECLLPVALRS